MDKNKEKERVIDLYKKGCRRNVIIEITGLSSSKVDKYLREEGYKYKVGRFTDKDKEMIKCSFEEGYSLSTIAELFCVTEVTVKNHITKLTGHSWQDKVTEEEKENMLLLTNIGFNKTQISKILGRSRGTVRKYLNEYQEQEGVEDNVWF